MSGLTVGVDVGGTKIAAGVVDAGGRILASTRRDTQADDAAAIVAAILDLVDGLRAEHDVEAIGVAAAGFVEAATGTVLFAPNLAWRDEPLQATLAQRSGLPVVVENDANAAAWGEFRFGAGADSAVDSVLVTVGTGVGGGIVVGGRLLRGQVGLAGELGHLRVVPDGRPCGCGNRGCWEQYASGTALQRAGRDLVAAGGDRAAQLSRLCSGDPQALRGSMITAAAQDGDQASVDLLADLGRWLGAGMASIAAVLDPARFLVGGGVVQAGDLILAPARAALAEQLTGRGHRPAVDVRAATLGGAAGLVGAADLARAGEPAG